MGKILLALPGSLGQIQVFGDWGVHCFPLEKINKSRWKGGSFNLLVFAGAVDSQTDVRLNRWKALGVAS